MPIHQSFQEEKQILHSYEQARISVIDPRPRFKVKHQYQSNVDMSMRYQPISFKKEDLIGSNYQINLLNQTNKDIQKKQFDFNIKQHKANVTIQYDTNPRGNSVSQKQQKQKHITNSQKKRQLSQSAPKHHHQAALSITNNNAQPLINLQIGNVKMVSQPKASLQQKKQIDLKFAMGQHQVQTKSNGKHRKNKSEYKSNKALSKSSVANKQRTKRKVGEQVSDFQDGMMFSFENKENQSMNMINKRDMTPNTKQNHNMSISSISSGSAQKILSVSGISNYNKKYIMDKSSFLKHLSPDRTDQNTKNNRTILEQDVTMFKEIKSNVSTLTNQQAKKKNIKIKRAATAGNQLQKVYVRGVDKLIQDNLKKNKSKEEEEILKKYLEDYRQKQKRVELSQRNQEVRKINASKIISNHQHKHSQVNQIMQFQNINYKKQRSKSCMNKTDNIFANIQKKEKQLYVQIIQEAPIQQQQFVQQLQEEKRERKREKSFVLEMKELKKEIDKEIKKEILEGKLDMVSASNKRTNLTTINVKTKKLKDENTSMTNQNSKEDIIYYQTRQRKKSKSRDSKVISQNIQKFIDKRKKAQLARKSMEQTLEHEKHLKIKENLHNLNRFVKSHFRQQSQNIFIKKLQPNQRINKDEQFPSKKLKPHFYKFKKDDESKILDLEGEMMFDKNNELGGITESYNNSPDKRDNNTSSDMQNDYSKMLKQLLSKAKKQKLNQKKKKGGKGFETLSIEPSPSKSKQQAKTQKVLRMKLKVPRPERQSSDQELSQNKGKKESNNKGYKDDYSPEYQGLLTAIKNELVPKIPEDRNASLVPPQSDIATLEQNMREQNSEMKGHDRKKSSLSQKSPSSIEQMRKQKVLMQRYGNSNAPSQSDTKFLIKLHSAAITIQQQIRKHLGRKGFYDEEFESQMYIDSELEGDFHYQLESGYKKNQLNAISLDQSKESTIQTKNKSGGYQGKMSPLRVKNFGIREFNNENLNKESNNFYGIDDNSNIEKVIVCSVINSCRPDGDDSLQNTQQYIPLRQKAIKPTEGQAPKQITISEIHAVQVDLDQSSSSQRKNMIPSLDFGRLHVKQEKKVKEDEDELSKEGSARNIFERNPFQEFSSKVHGEDFNMNQYPELLKLREDAIKYKEQTEQKYINKMYKAKQFSPRTYDLKRKELETWVSKEKDEVKKSRKTFEKQWQKASYMIDQTQKDQDMMKKMLMDSGRISLPSKRDNDQILLSQRIASSRREPTLIDMIYEKNQEQQPTNNLEKQLQEQLEQEKRKHKESEEKNKQQIQVEEQKKKSQVEDERKKRLDEAEKRKKQEEQDRQRHNDKQKEVEKRQQEVVEDERKRKEGEKKQKEDEIKKQREEVEKRRKEEEDIQKQKDQELKKKQDSQEKIRRDEEEKARKVKEERQKNENEKQRKAGEKETENQKKIQEEKSKQQLREEREKKNQDIQKKLDTLNQKFSSYSPQKQKEASLSSQESLKHLQKHTASNQNKYDEEDDLKSEPDMGMEKDIFSQDKENQLISQILRIPSQKQLQELSSEIDEDQKQVSSRDEKVEEPSRGLSRTRSSQDLKENKDISSEESKEESEQEEVEDLLKNNLNDKSIDEDQSTKSIARPLNKNNFFTKNFDEEKAEDLFEKYKNSTTADLKQIINLDDIQLNQDDLSSEERNEKTAQDKIESLNKVNKIYIEDKGEELLQLEQIHLIQEEQNKNKRMPQSLRNQIPVEEEEKYLPAMPVSPASMDGGDLRIQTGSQSLESTLSDDKKLKQAIQEAQKTEKSSADEKEDIVDEITDDIFRALMAEMKLELDLLLMRDPRKLFKEDEQAPQNYFLSESGRFLIFERKGIKTDLFAIERYVEEVLDEVIKEKNKFIISINSPLSKKSLEVLNQLQNSEIGSYEHFEVNFPNILPLDLYLKLEKRRKENRERERELREEGKESLDKNFLAECEHIHNKVLFDCINDSLLQFKPYGKDGVPLPWSRQSRRLKPIEDFTIEEMFEIVKHDLFRWAIMQAGTLPRKEFVFGGVFDDELFAEIREKKLATLLAREMIENEPKWLNYEFEEAQVKIDIGDMILEQLVTETINILNQRIQI